MLRIAFRFLFKNVKTLIFQRAFNTEFIFDKCAMLGMLLTVSVFYK